MTKQTYDTAQSATREYVHNFIHYFSGLSLGSIIVKKIMIGIIKL